MGRGRQKKIRNINDYIDEVKQFDKITDWKEQEPHHYRVAREAGFIDELKKYVKSYFDSSTENMIRIAKQHESVRSWSKNDRVSYGKLKKHPERKLIVSHLKNRVKKINVRGHWTLERCIEDARKYENKRQWRLASQSAYGTALRKGWIAECSSHMTKLQNQKPSGYWTKERCLESARKYNRPSDWGKHESGGKTMAVKKGWYEECIAHMTVRQTASNGHWNIKENVLNEAKKYEKKIDWSNNQMPSYTSAKKNGWFEEATAHMKVKSKIIDDLTTQKLKYTSSREWFLDDKISYYHAIKNGTFDDLTAHMTDFKSSSVRKMISDIDNLEHLFTNNLGLGPSVRNIKNLLGLIIKHCNEIRKKSKDAKQKSI